MKFKVILTILLGLIVLNANAAYQFDGKNQFYMGVGAGWGGMLTYKASNLPQSIGDGTSYTAKSLHDGLSYRGNLGYLWAVGHDNYGLELGYMGYPKNTYDIDNVHPRLAYKGHSIDALIVLQHNYNDGWFIAGKLGAAYVVQQLQNSQSDDYLINNNSIFGTDRKVLPEVALSAGYNITQHIGVDISAHYIFGGSDNQNLTNASSAANVRRVASVAAGFIGAYLRF